MYSTSVPSIGQPETWQSTMSAPKVLLLCKAGFAELVKARFGTKLLDQFHKFDIARKLMKGGRMPINKICQQEIRNEKRHGAGVLVLQFHKYLKSVN